MRHVPWTIPLRVSIAAGWPIVDVLGLRLGNAEHGLEPARLDDPGELGPRLRPLADFQAQLLEGAVRRPAFTSIERMRPRWKSVTARRRPTCASCSASCESAAWVIT